MKSLGCALLMSLLAAAVSQADEIVLFDAATATPKSIASMSGAKCSLNGDLLEVAARGESGYPGVAIRGNWDLSKCNRVTVEMSVLDNRGGLPITIRLDNPGSNPAKGQNVFVDRVTISGKKLKTYDVKLPPVLPHSHEIASKLFGMRKTPFQTVGVVADLNPANVAGVSLTINQPKLDWRWGVKRIVAHTGPATDVPAWMKMTPEEFFPFIDVYGQFKHKDWPGKTHGDADFKATVKREEADLAAHPGVFGWDKFGGWGKGPTLKATGHFRVQKYDGRWWMVDPEGHLFWSHGPVRVTSSSSVTPLDGREFYFTDLPKADSPFALFYTTHDALLWPYYEALNIKRTYDFSSANAFRKYGPDWAARYADAAHRRLRSWGMNTIANSSDPKICRMDRTPYTDRIELKSPVIEGAVVNWWKFKDPFHPEFRTKLREQLQARKAELDDPWCLGFFVDNEIGWGSPTSLAEWTIQSPAEQPVKIEFVAQLKKQYGDIAKLNEAWRSNFADWDALLKSRQKPPAGAQADCKAFSDAIADAYFKNTHDVFKEVAPNALYLGCRFAGSTPAAVRSSAKYCDVVSYNYYAKDFSHFKLPDGIDKPVMIGEFHFGALDRGLFHPSLIQVANQEERGKAYATYVKSALEHPNVIGVHWHQYSDEPTSGRFDGEDFQNGLVDCCDTPYWETIDGVRKVGYRMYAIRSQAVIPEDPNAKYPTDAPAAVSVDVDCSKVVGPRAKPESYWNTTILHALPPALADRAMREYGRAKITRCWVTLPQLWNRKTDAYNFNFKIRRRVYEDKHQKNNPEGTAVKKVVLAHENVEDYLDAFSRVSDEILLNIRGYEKGVLDGSVGIKKWREVFTKAVRHYKERYPNLRYIEALNEFECAAAVGGLKTTQDQYYPFYQAGYEAVNEVNGELKPAVPLLVGGPCPSSYNKAFLHRFLENYAKDANPAKRLDFVSFHDYGSGLTPSRYGEFQNYFRGEFKQFGVPENLPIFMTEVGFGGGMPTPDPDRNVAQAAALTTYVYNARQSDNLKVFPWVLFHSRHQLSFAQFTQEQEMTAFGAAVKTWAMHRKNEIAATVEPKQDELGVYAFASLDDAGAAIEVWNYQSRPNRKHPTCGSPADVNIALRNLPAKWRQGKLKVRQTMIDATHSNVFAEGGKAGLQQVKEMECGAKDIERLSVHLEPNGLCLWTIEAKQHSMSK
jgi:hypothetical protein